MTRITIVEEKVEHQEEIIENEITGVYKIIQINFNGEDDWVLSDSETDFKVTIQDYNFMSKVMNSEVSFSFRDKVKCHMLMKQSIVHDVVDDVIDTQYTVTKVLEHKRFGCYS